METTPLLGATLVPSRTYLWLWGCFFTISVYYYSSFHSIPSIVDRVLASQFSGVLGVRKTGKVVFTQAYGMANEELQVPFQVHHTFGIASNSKLFVAVALYQLQEQGKVQLQESIASYLSPSDFQAFGFPNQTTWCPKLPNSTQCETITFEQLLAMSSGIVDAFNCDNIPLHSPYCVSFDGLQWSQYKGSIGPYVGMFLNSPLAFRPGTNYSYSNPNFILGAYMIEKLSHLSFAEYLRTYIIAPLQLNQTMFNEHDGQFDVIPYYADSYNTFFRNSLPSHVGTCRPYLSLGGFNGAGGVVSTVDNLMQWYEALFSKEGSILLSDASIQALIKPWNKVPGDPASYYGQGIFVNYQTMEQHWPTEILYCGELKCTFSCISMKWTSSDEHVITAAFTNHGHVYYNSTDQQEMEHRGVDHMIRAGKAIQKLGNAPQLRAYLMDMFLNQ